MSESSDLGVLAYYDPPCGCDPRCEPRTHADEPWVYHLVLLLEAGDTPDKFFVHSQEWLLRPAGELARRSIKSGLHGLAELSTAHEAGIGYRKLAKALGTDPASVMRYLRRNAPDLAPMVSA